MSGGRHTREARSGGGLVVILVGLALVGLLVWWSVDRFTGSGDSGSVTTGSGARSPAASNGDSGAGGDGQGGADQAGSDAQAVIQKCAAELADTEHIVHAAGRGVDSWRSHTKARTDMLADRISERRMEKIYDRTKRRGHAAQHHFHAELSALEHTVPCQGLRDQPKGSSGQGGHDCLIRSRAAAAALRTARSTMHEWQLHLRHMHQYADGGMSTGKAMALWVKAWRRAPEGISAYDHKRSELDRAPRCRSGTDG